MTGFSNYGYGKLGILDPDLSDVPHAKVDEKSRNV